jgi:nicotinamidase-related amidase
VEDTAPMITGRPVVISVDIQRGYALPAEQTGISLMEGHADLIANAERIVVAARAAGIPIIFFSEVHRPDGIDFGRELDGDEGVHCLEGDMATELWPTLTPGPGEYAIAKRRYSCFFGTDLEILLKGLGASTLILIGGLTDVCVHYTFADGHQHDYRMRVVSDCVLGSSRARHAASLSAMEYLQHGACRTTTEVLDAFATYGATTPLPAMSSHKGAA